MKESIVSMGPVVNIYSINKEARMFGVFSLSELILEHDDKMSKSN